MTTARAASAPTPSSSAGRRAEGPDRRHDHRSARRILHLVDRLDGRGGAYRYLDALAAAQAERDDVWIAGGTGARSEGRARRALVPGLETRGPAPLDLDALADRLRPDVIHVHTVLNPVALRWAAARGAVMTVQDHRYFCPARGRWTAEGRVCADPVSPALCAACFDDDAYRDEMVGLTAQRLSAVRAMRHVTVLSRYMRQELLDAGLAAERVSIVAPFAAPALRDTGPGAHVLFVGRLVAAKGPLDAVSAWRRSGTPLPLLVAGGGPLRAAMEEGGARVLGWLDDAALARCYAGAAALLLPSRWQEPFGMAGLEALARGVPVVAWDSGGVADWHPGPLVPWGDVEGLAAELGRVLRVAPAPHAPPFTRAEMLRRQDAVYRRAAGGGSDGLGSGATGSMGSDGATGGTDG